MPLDFAVAICESEAAPVDALDAFFVAPPAEDELVAGAAAEVPAGAEFEIGAAALGFAADDLLLPAAAFEPSAAPVPESATGDFSALFFLLLLVPAVLVLADSLAPSLEAAAVVSDFLLFLLLFDSLVFLLAGWLEVSPDAVLASDFLLFLLLLFAELLSAVAELAELSDALFFDELASEFVLLVVLSELAFFFDFLLLVEVAPWSAEVAEGVSWDWARTNGTAIRNNRHIPAAQAVNLREKVPFIDLKPTFPSAKVAAGQTNSERCVLRCTRPRSDTLEVRYAVRHHPLRHLPCQLSEERMQRPWLRLLMSPPLRFRAPARGGCEQRGDGDGEIRCFGVGSDSFGMASGDRLPVRASESIKV